MGAQSWLSFAGLRPCDQVALGRRTNESYASPMKLRTRKALGIVLSVAFLTLYSLIAMAFGGVFIVGKGAMAEAAFYVVAGLAWLPVEMAIIRWMSKPDAA